MRALQKVYLVDDEPDFGNAYVPIIQAWGYQAVYISSGSEAVHRASVEPPDLILLDIMMPGMDGYEVLARLKQGEKTRHVPVIILSGMFTDQGSIDHARSLGAVDYLTKPFDFYALQMSLKTHLPKPGTKPGAPGAAV